MKPRHAALSVILASLCAGLSPTAFAFDVACGMVCADNSPGSACMSSCATQNSGSSGGGGRTHYGAIAISPATLAYGFSFRFASRRQAEEAALSYCHGNRGKPHDCRVAVWFSNTCGSLAIKPDSGKRDGAWGADWASSAAAARRKALAKCEREAARGCATAVTVCAAQ